MHKRRSLSQASTLATLVACLGAWPVSAAAQQEPAPAQQEPAAVLQHEPAAVQQEKAATPAPVKWKIYRDERYAFRLSYPADSQVQKGKDRGYQYMRVQNYEPDPGQTAMQPGEYHLEVLIFDHRLGHRMRGSCRELVREAHQVRAGKVNALRGLAEQNEDAPGTSFALCLQAGKVDVLVMATERDPLGPLANRLLDAVRFGN
jgi:hypothetical protein